MPIEKTMRQGFEQTLEVFLTAAPMAASVAGLPDIMQSFFYCGAGTAFKVVQHLAALKVDGGMPAIQALTDAFDEVVREIAATARDHEAELLAKRSRMLSEGASNG